MTKKPSISTETLLDTAMVLQNIRLLVEDTDSPTVRLHADLINMDNEYFMEQYGEPIYPNEDDIPVHFWERYYDLRDTELSVLKAADRYGAFDSLHIQTSDEEDPVGMGIILKRPRYYEITINPTEFERYFNVIVTLAESRVYVTAHLNFRGIGTPVVTVGNKSYEFPTLRTGKVMEIILYCFEKHINEQVSLSTLQENLNISGVSNITETLRHSLFDPATGSLDLFVESSTKSIIVKDSAAISKALAKSFASTGKLV